MCDGIFTKLGAISIILKIKYPKMVYCFKTKLNNPHSFIIKFTGLPVRLFAPFWPRFNFVFTMSPEHSYSIL